MLLHCCGRLILSVWGTWTLGITNSLINNVISINNFVIKDIKKNPNHKKKTHLKTIEWNQSSLRECPQAFTKAQVFTFHARGSFCTG